MPPNKIQNTETETVNRIYIINNSPDEPMHSEVLRPSGLKSGKKVRKQRRKD